MRSSFRRGRRRGQPMARTSGPLATPSLRSHDRVQVPRVSSQGRAVADGGPTPRQSREVSSAARAARLPAVVTSLAFARCALRLRLASAAVRRFPGSLLVALVLLGAACDRNIEPFDPNEKVE